MSSFTALTMTCPRGHCRPGGVVGTVLRWLLLLTLSLLPCAGASAVDIIAHQGIAANSLSQAALRAILGMRQPRWPDGQPVRVFVLPDLNQTHIAFCKEKLNLYPYQLRQSWDRLVYSGLGQAPTEVATEEEMIARIRATPGALGYVNKVKQNDNVRTLVVD